MDGFSNNKKPENRGEGGAAPNLSMAEVSHTFPDGALVCQEEGEQSNSLIARKISWEIFVSPPVRHFGLSKPPDVRAGSGSPPKQCSSAVLPQEQRGLRL